MLLELAQWLAQDIRAFIVFGYITLRAVLAPLTALSIGLIFGPWVIRKLTEMKIGQAIRTDGPQSHLIKSGTPTMGGALILISIGVTTLLWADLSQSFRLGRADRHARLRLDRLGRRLPQGRAPQSEGHVGEGEVLLAVADRPASRRSTGVRDARAVDTSRRWRCSRLDLQRLRHSTCRRRPT